ncbi:hypothetical protein ROP_35690 [Rhodococcus opacus B4]|uniref:Uncharacterized protein n=1 Tax=Rhodococcus opacus (strain B4) TaxID=632772 RepID=C1B813_RHOOB|nr:hypothetical protein ROP_35690 [Rhodococcus opacus B4]
MPHRSMHDERLFGIPNGDHQRDEIGAEHMSVRRRCSSRNGIRCRSSKIPGQAPT